MTKYKGDYELIKNVLSQVIKEYNGTTAWENDNTLKFISPAKRADGSIVLKDTEITVTAGKIDALWKKIDKLYTEKSKAVVEEALINGTPLKDLLGVPSNYGNIQKKPVIVTALLAELKKLNIKTVGVYSSLRQDNTVKNDLSLYFCTSPDNRGEQLESGYYGRLKTFLFGRYKTNKKKKDDLSIQETYRFTNLEGETSVRMEIEGTLVGEYYPERNFVDMYYNPFKLQDYPLFNDDIPQVFSDIFTLLKTVGVKKKDVADVQEKIFITGFLKKTRDKLDSVKSMRSDYTRKIGEYQNKVRSSIDGVNEAIAEIDFIETLLQNKGKGLYGEVNKVKTLPFIESVTIEGSTIDLKFKPTSLAMPYMMRNDSGKKFGKKHFWIGSIGFKISPERFEAYGEVNIANHAHPHIGGFPQGSPCFGGGEGKDKIFHLLSVNKFVDLAKMLWFWVHTYVNSGAYVKVWKTYDECLSRGIPIWDDDGTRIQLNDPVRIKAGEQAKLDKHADFAKNTKKFADLILEV